MKKLVVLALVLSVASLANAAFVPMSTSYISMTYSGTTYTVTGNTTSDVWFGIYELGQTNVFSNIVGTANMCVGVTNGLGNIGRDTDNSTYDGLILAAQSDGLSTPPVLVQTGVWCTFTYTGPGHTFDIQDASNSYADVGNITATAIPEPMTMTLLGLGGLLFVRKK